MNTSEILEAIDQEILKLQQARALLAETPAIQAAAGKRRGRPKSYVNKYTEVIAPVLIKPAKRTMSAEGKARIAAAQKVRWAKKKKTSKPAKAATKKIAPKPAKKAVPAVKKIATKIAKKTAVALKLATKKIAAKLSNKTSVVAKKTGVEPVAEA